MKFTVTAFNDFISSRLEWESSVLAGNFQMNLGYLASSSIVFFLQLLRKRTFAEEDKWHKYFTEWMPFQSPNQRCQNTEGNSKRDINQ